MKQPQFRYITSRAKLKHPGILQKELTLFGEKEGKPGDVNLGIIHFGFGEVRIHR